MSTKKTDTYTQCKLQASGDILTQYSWIPTQFAVVGKKLELFDGTRWHYGWYVRETFTTRPAAEVEARSLDYQRTRMASDL